LVSVEWRRLQKNNNGITLPTHALRWQNKGNSRALQHNRINSEHLFRCIVSLTKPENALVSLDNKI
jgi:hypothetical protein